jgi:segregation and condensation protein B
MIKKEKVSKDNIVKFPSKLTDLEREIEAVIFAAAEPLDVDTIESKISKKANVAQSLEKLQNEYSNRGINLVCIKDKWSFRTSPKLSNLMTQEKTVEKNYPVLQ